jgi:mannose-1-phosphate guanylyltransferase
MVSDFYGVIMAGGGGTRLWPLSRQKSPKQVLPIFGDQSLFQVALNRLQGLIAPENTFVVTTEALYQILAPTAPQLTQSQYLLEPMPRGTASVVGLSAAILSLKNPNAVMAVLTADHIIQNVKLFQEYLLQAYQIAQTGDLVTLGIQPTFPSTGYGYIETGEKIGLEGISEAFKVARFVEKPDLENASRMVDSGRYFWNSGMFIWRVDTILHEFEIWMPELYTKLMEIKASWNTTERTQKLAAVWPTIKPETIDYGIMEKAKRVAVIRAADLNWNDVGSWNSLTDVIPPNAESNLILANNSLQLGARSTIVYEDQSEKLVALIGTEDLIVIDTKDALLVCKKEDSQRIKEIVQMIKDQHRDKYL